MALVDAAMLETNTAFDVIFLDIRMPGQDGLVVARHIRQAERQAGRPRSKLIALTADLYDSTSQRAAEAGIDEVVTKPVDFRRIGRLLEEVAAARPRIESQQKSLAAVS
jgi:CheY-like chemotaxis protein